MIHILIWAGILSIYKYYFVHCSQEELKRTKKQLQTFASTTLDIVFFLEATDNSELIITIVCFLLIFLFYILGDSKLDFPSNYSH